MCYTFGLKLYQRLLQEHNESIPIGLVNAAYGGSPIEAWSSPTAILQCPYHPDSLCNKANTNTKKEKKNCQNHFVTRLFCFVFT